MQWVACDQHWLNTVECLTIELITAHTSTLQPASPTFQISVGDTSTHSRSHLNWKLCSRPKFPRASPVGELVRICLQCGRLGFDPWVGKIPWRRERLPAPVFWPGEFHGLYSLWDRKESDMTEQLSLSLPFIGNFQNRHIYRHGVDHNKLWKILKEMGIPDNLICLLRNLYAGQKATVRTGHGTTDWFQIRKGVRQGCIFVTLFI